MAFAAAGAALGGCCPLAESYPSHETHNKTLELTPEAGAVSQDASKQTLYNFITKIPRVVFIHHMKSVSGIKHDFIFTIFLACSSQSGVWCVMSNTGMEHCCPSANLAVQLAKSCCERFKRMSTEDNEGKNTDPKGSMRPPAQDTPQSMLVQTVLRIKSAVFSMFVVTSCAIRGAVKGYAESSAERRGEPCCCTPGPLNCPCTPPCLYSAALPKPHCRDKL